MDVDLLHRSGRQPHQRRETTRATSFPAPPARPAGPVELLEPSSPPSSSSPTSGRDKAVTATRRHDASSSASSKRPPPPPVPTAPMPSRAEGGRSCRLPAVRASARRRRADGLRARSSAGRKGVPIPDDAAHGLPVAQVDAVHRIRAPPHGSGPGLRPDMQVRKKSGTRTSGTEYQGLRIRHLYPFRTCLPRSLSVFRNGGRQVGVLRDPQEHHGLVGTTPPLDGPGGQGPGRQHPAGTVGWRSPSGIPHASARGGSSGRFPPFPWA